MRKMKAGQLTNANRWRSTLLVNTEEWNDLESKFRSECLDGWDIESVTDMGEKSKVLFKAKKNLVVDAGVQNALDRLYGIGGGPLITMGVDDGASNPIAGTASSSAGSTNRRLVAFDAAPVRTGLTVSSEGTFTDSNVSFVMKRLFLSRAAAGTTDTTGDLYAMTNVFTIDLTSFATWSQTFEATTTGSGS